MRLLGQSRAVFKPSEHLHSTIFWSEIQTKKYKHRRYFSNDKCNFNITSTNKLSIYCVFPKLYSMVQQVKVTRITRISTII